MVRNANESEEQGTNRAPGAMKPVSLTSVNLRTESAREIAAANIEARETELTPYGHHSEPAKAINEHRFSFAPISERRPDLRPETSINYSLQTLTITPMQMQELRERRIAARDLGWVIPGHRIRIQS